MRKRVSKLKKKKRKKKKRGAHCVEALDFLSKMVFTIMTA